MLRKVQVNRWRRQRRGRGRIRGTAERPRLSVFRSNRHIYAQLIDDQKGVTLAAASDSALEGGTPQERAVKVGEALAAAARKRKIGKVVFDRGRYSYHGRVAAVAEGARRGGLEF